jgi:hypothetical protein
MTKNKSILFTVYMIVAQLTVILLCQQYVNFVCIDARICLLKNFVGELLEVFGRALGQWGCLFPGPEQSECEVRY